MIPEHLLGCHYPCSEMISSMIDIPFSDTWLSAFLLTSIAGVTFKLLCQWKCKYWRKCGIEISFLVHLGCHSACTVHWVHNPSSSETVLEIEFLPVPLSCQYTLDLWVSLISSYKSGMWPSPEMSQDEAENTSGQRALRSVPISWFIGNDSGSFWLQRKLWSSLTSSRVFWLLSGPTLGQILKCSLKLLKSPSTCLAPLAVCCQRMTHNFLWAERSWVIPQWTMR